MSDLEKAKEFTKHLMDTLDTIYNVTLWNDMSDSEKVSVINKMSDFPYLTDNL